MYDVHCTTYNVRDTMHIVNHEVEFHKNKGRRFQVITGQEVVLHSPSA